MAKTTNAGVSDADAYGEGVVLSPEQVAETQAVRHDTDAMRETAERLTKAPEEPPEKVTKEPARPAKATGSKRNTR